MILREAKIEDIKQMQVVRNAVKEKVLSNPDLIKDKDYEEFLLKKGKGWVFEIEATIVGFSIVDLKENNVWALFVLPNFEKRGIGIALHDEMLNWYFSQTNTNIWLGTAFNTRAEYFYKKAGWVEVGTHGAKEIKFEMTKATWSKRNNYS